MTARAQTHRTRRGRILIVNDDGNWATGLARLAPPPIVVNNPFEALGEITVAKPGEPITTVLISERWLNSTGKRFVESARKLDPSVQLVLVAHSERASNQSDWGELGFDDCLRTPIQPGEVVRIFADQASFQSPPPTSQSTEPEQAVATQSRQPAAQDQGIAELIAMYDTEKESPSTAESQHNLPFQQLSSATADVLGDTDLVESIMNDPEGVLATALRLVQQQTGWNDIAFDDQSGKTDSPRVMKGVAVTYDGSRYGVLQSENATAGDLQPWADWLARWLALEDQYRSQQVQAMQDDLTGAGNRRFYERFLSVTIDDARRARRPITVMVFDIDNFKSFNDKFGHEAGDEILCETVRLLNSIIRQGDRVCRIGGDEFAVIFADADGPREPGSSPPESVDVLAKRFQQQVCSMRFPKLGPEAPDTLSISAGLATFPWDGDDPTELLYHADRLALESKRKGKNVITLGPGAKQICNGNS